MAFDYNEALQYASELKKNATILYSYKNSVLSIKSSIYDHWKNAVVPQVPELIEDSLNKIEFTYEELLKAASDIEAAAKLVQEAEIKQQEEERRRIEQEELKKQELNKQKEQTQTDKAETDKTARKEELDSQLKELNKTPSRNIRAALRLKEQLRNLRND